MKVFVTGATGFIGGNLVQKLAEQGHRVHALYRDITRIKGLEHENIQWFHGSLDEKEMLDKAMRGCTHACHLGAYTTMLVRKPENMYEKNVGGTSNILESAVKEKLQRVVFVSTAGVFGPSDGGKIDENTPYPGDFITHYISSKILAEKKVLDFVKKGIDACIVNPTRVYGPGRMSTSNAARLADLYLQGKLKILPGGGRAKGNYVYVDDVSEGIIRVLEKGRNGERYLLGGEDLSMLDYINRVRAISGYATRMVGMPFFIILLVSYLLFFIAWISGWAPPFTPAEVRRFMKDWMISSKKAETELQYNPRSFDKGMKTTISWLKKQYTP